MAELDNLIDSRISLISHQDVRYDGTLFSINTTESSIVLKDVKCLGTEGRVTDESKKVAASNAVIPFVTFPGQEIKDLYVHEGADSAPPAPAAKKQDNRQNNRSNNNNAAPPRPPSNNGQRPQQQQQRQYNNNNNQSNNNNQNNNNNRRQNQSNQQQSKPQQQQQQQQQQAPREPREPRPQSNAGTGAHLLHMKERKSSDATSSNAAVDGVFDFEAGLSVFKKEEVLAKVATEEETKAAAKYKKDDFFDLLSTDRSSREEGISTRLTASQERSLNQDTFGAIALQGNGGYRRNYGGGGRGGNNNNFNGGGRGGGRGRGRGGYYRNNNNNNSGN